MALGQSSWYFGWFFPFLKFPPTVVASLLQIRRFVQLNLLKINPHPRRKRKKLCTSNAKVMKKICSCVGESSIVLIRRYKTVKTQKDSISQFLEVLFFLFWNWLEERSDFYFSFFLLSPVTVIWRDWGGCMSSQEEEKHKCFKAVYLESYKREEIEKQLQKPWLWLMLSLFPILLSTSLSVKLFLRQRLVLEYALASLLADGWTPIKSLSGICGVFYFK